MDSGSNGEETTSNGEHCGRTLLEVSDMSSLPLVSDTLQIGMEIGQVDLGVSTHSRLS